MLLTTLALLADATEAPAKSAGSTSGFDLIPILFIVFCGYLLLIRPVQKERKQQQQLLAALKKGDRVLVNGFLIGTVVQLVSSGAGKDDELLVKIDDNANVKLRVLRSSVTRILTRTDDKDSKDGGA